MKIPFCTVPVLYSLKSLTIKIHMQKYTSWNLNFFLLSKGDEQERARKKIGLDLKSAVGWIDYDAVAVSYAASLT